MYKIATLFSGGEGVGVGARAAGLHHLWGIEHDADIADVARANGFKTWIASVTWPWLAHGLPRPDVLHASPPCPEFSPAKTGGQEGWKDIAVARGVARFIRVMCPRIFTLENVWAYRKSKSWRIIAQALGEGGYMFDVAHLNSADMGVPQSRKRMWVRAVRGGFVPHLPEPEPWVGWYAAIEDLLPGLPDDEFAPWQLERMPAELRETVLLAQGSYDHTDAGNDRAAQPIGKRREKEPAYTVTGNSSMLGMRALLMSAGNAHNPTLCEAGEPARTVVGSHPALGMRAFLASNSGAQGRGLEPRDDDLPSPAVLPGAHGRWRAFVIDAGNASRPATIRYEDEPVNTIVAAACKGPKSAFIMDGQNASRKPTTRTAEEPTFAVTNAGKGLPRAAVHGRVVRLTVRCLARFQSFPDSYILPDGKTLAARVVGNAVPPLWYEKLIGCLIR